MKKLKSKIKLDLQIVSNYSNIPTKKLFSQWVAATLNSQNAAGEVCIRVVNNKEIKILNNIFRHTNKVTNVLAFPSVPLPGVKNNNLGDVILCAPYINREARQLNLPAKLHWAHITIHGILHLLGYDHHTEKQAIAMEKKEMEIMQKNGFKIAHE